MVSIPLVTFELLLERIGEKELSDKCKAFIKQQDIIERSKKLVPISLRQLNLLENAAKKEPEKVLPLIQEIKLNSSNFKTNKINSFKKLNYNSESNSDINSFKKLNIPTDDGEYNNTIINDFKPLKKDIELKPMNYKMNIVDENEDFILNFKNLRKQRNVLNNRNGKNSKNSKNKTIKKNKKSIEKKSIEKKNGAKKNSTRKNISKRIRNIMKMTNYTNNDSNMLNI